jgi:hypothetical protein
MSELALTIGFAAGDSPQKREGIKMDSVCSLRFKGSRSDGNSILLK